MSSLEFYPTLDVELRNLAWVYLDLGVLVTSKVIDMTFVSQVKSNDVPYKGNDLAFVQNLPTFLADCKNKDTTDEAVPA